MTIDDVKRLADKYADAYLVSVLDDDGPSDSNKERHDLGAAILLLVARALDDERAQHAALDEKLVLLKRACASSKEDGWQHLTIAGIEAIIEEPAEVTE